MAGYLGELVHIRVLYTLTVNTSNLHVLVLTRGVDY